MRIGLLTQWYDPEPGPAALPGVLARGLSERGHDVHVLTGFPNYPSGRIAEGYAVRRRLVEHVNGVTVTRVALYPSHDGSTARRMLNYGSFGASAVVNGLGALRGLDALWVNYSPVTVGGAQLLARAVLGVPSVVHVLDLWPDTLFAGGFANEGRLGGIVRRGLDAWCDAMYRAASSVAYISPGVGDVLRSRGVAADKLYYVPMWADEAVFRPADADLRADYGLRDDSLVLLYAGAMGDAQGLDTLVEACAQIDDPRFRCLMAGSGISESRLRESAARIDNVRFIGRVSQAQMTALMATADLNYVGLRAHALTPITMPSKTQATLAAGKPLLVAAHGDVADIVTQSGTGLTADPADATSIAAAIRRALALGRPGLAEMGRRAAELYATAFSARRGVDQVEDLLRRASAGRQAARTKQINAHRKPLTTHGEWS